MEDCMIEEPCRGCGRACCICTEQDLADDHIALLNRRTSELTTQLADREYRLAQAEVQLAERDKALAGAREAMEAFAGKSGFFPNDPPRLVDIGTSIRALQRVDAALAALPPTPQRNPRQKSL